MVVSGGSDRFEAEIPNSGDLACLPPLSAEWRKREAESESDETPISRMGTSMGITGGSLAERYDAHQGSAARLVIQTRSPLMSSSRSPVLGVRRRPARTAGLIAGSLPQAGRGARTVGAEVIPHPDKPSRVIRCSATLDDTITLLAEFISDADCLEVRHEDAPPDHAPWLSLHAPA
jgi:hypothetical protein